MTRGADSIFDEAETTRFMLWLGKVGADLQGTTQPMPLSPHLPQSAGQASRV